MAENLPEPLTPADCDLRSYDWMPTFGNNLYTSYFDAHANDAEFRAANRLWWAAWLEVPAASFPDDDLILCRQAGFGRDLKAWGKVKKMALHGFIKCSDGRLYHEFLSTLAVKAFERRLKADRKRSDDRDRLKTWRDTRKSETGSEATENAAGNASDTRDETPNDTNTKHVVKRVSSDVERERESKKESKQQLLDSKPREKASTTLCRSDPPDRWAPHAEKWEVDREGVRRPVVNGDYLDITADLALDAAGINDVNWRGDFRPLIAWMRDGIDGRVIIETIRQVAARPDYKPPASLAYFDKPIRERAGLECAA